MSKSEFELAKLTTRTCMPNPQALMAHQLSAVVAGRGGGTVNGKEAHVFAPRNDVTTQMDVAAALAGLPRHVYLFARFIFCLDDLVGAELCELTRRELVRLVPDLMTKHDVSRRCARVAVFEARRPAVCLRCNGLGYFQGEGERIMCKSCDGIGRKTFTQRARAEIAGVDESTWRQCYKRPYTAARRMVAGWSGAIEGHLREQLMPAETTAP